MVIPHAGGPYRIGYTPIIERSEKHKEMLTDFGILNVDGSHPYKSTAETERAFLLLYGHVYFEWSSKGRTISLDTERESLLDEEPSVVHVPGGVEVLVSGKAEIAIQGSLNGKEFTPRVWRPGEYRSEQFGAGILQNTSTRIVRTVFDAATAPDSAMVLGEVVNFPGKWSSYPPHHHAQPEIYHFRFFPRQGFGFSAQGKKVFYVHDRDTATIPPNVAHPQTAAPGYAMYYIWMIPHLPTDRFGPDSRIYEKEHEWVMNPKAPIWPNAPS
jgi:5-deoxy-glucuronate isomerase